MAHSIGILELSSIASGYEAEDAMLKAADVHILIARTICSGKFIVVIGGSVSAVEAALETGKVVSRGFLIESLHIANVDPQVFAALSGSVDASECSYRSLGIVETFAATPIIEAADAAVKAANILLLRVHVSMAIGGKGYFLALGDTAAIQAAVDAATDAIRESGLLVNRVIIPAATPEVLKEFI
ncbi:BMC domain-containing protein [Desulfobulbus rhabdoformis]|uniref:BMC domain-containing protein n=1 Tax=Desulfobulbus rhabdoformis TaxID=34032 RepID=UPI001962AB8D|nr:BMC domain-containing protein [Desulfobulbus rhabdoformis]MBM9613758.1 BMC domain-containing protein [Desulfobulbus rhabdoformis]